MKDKKIFAFRTISDILLNVKPSAIYTIYSLKFSNEYFFVHEGIKRGILKNIEESVLYINKDKLYSIRTDGLEYLYIYLFKEDDKLYCVTTSSMNAIDEKLLHNLQQKGMPWSNAFKLALL